MKEIDVRQQPRMGVARTFNLTVNGIKYRLFRSAVTVGVIAVAIAFMMNVLSESIVKGSVAQQTGDRARYLRKASWWAARLANPGSLAEVLESVAATDEGDSSYVETRRMGRIEESAMPGYRLDADAATKYLQFFAEMDFPRRRVLVGTAEGTSIFEVLRDPEEYKRFSATLADMRGVRFVTPMPEFESFLQKWPEIRATTERIQQGRKRAIDGIKKILGERRIIVQLADAEGEFGKAIRAQGFSFPEEEAKIVAAQSRDILDKRALEETTSKPEARRLIAARKDILPAEVNIAVVWDLFSSRSEARWYLNELKKLDIDVPLQGITGTDAAVERAYELAKKRAEEYSIASAERASSDVGSGFWGMGERMSWLLFASMLVCVVGVTNAMLMSVTERFREIATLKCLGAMDDFIMLMFVFEAGLLGLVGGLAGAVAGGIIGVGRMFTVFGFYMLPLIPVGRLFIAILLSIGVGMLLAAVGAVYPSLKAARLAPMEAMRIQ